MPRQQRLTLAIYLVSPLLVFTLWTGLLVVLALTTASTDRELWVENQTQQSIRVVPFGWKGHVRTHRVGHYTSFWQHFWTPRPADYVEIPPGESCRMLVDHWGAMDTNSHVDLAVQSAGGEYRFIEWKRESRI